MAKSTTVLGKTLYNAMKSTGLITYGSHISNTWLYSIVGITMPVTGTRTQFQTLALRELGIVEYARNKLLDQGMYMKSTGTGYRILLLSENADQIEIYRRAAAKKLNRARKLAKSSPIAAFQGINNPLPAIMAARKSIRKKAVKNKPSTIAPLTPPIIPTPSIP